MANKFQYAIVFRVPGKGWGVIGPKVKGQADLLTLLNVLGNKGWEVAGTGDFGQDSRAEILLKRQSK